MKLSERSYPHPVVGNRDDVPGASFQASMEVSMDAQYVFVDVSIVNGSDKIREIVANQLATYAIHVECSNTLHRSLYRSSDERFRVTLKKESLNHVVEVNAFVVAAGSIPEYYVDGQHSDYGQHKFYIKTGDILAVSAGQQFTIDRDYVSFEDVDSIVKVVPFPPGADRAMHAQYDEDKIVVSLSAADFRQYSLVRNSRLAPILASLIVLPIITDAVRLLHDSQDDYDQRWARAIRDKVKELRLSMEDPMECAQRLLELPIKRSLGVAVAAQEEQ